MNPNLAHVMLYFTYEYLMKLYPQADIFIE